MGLNINTLSPESYSVVNQPNDTTTAPPIGSGLNINSLPQGSYKVMNQSASPQTPQTLMGDAQNVANFAEKYVPGGKVLQNIGTLGAYMIAKIGDTIAPKLTGGHLADNVSLDAPSPLQTTADAANMVLMAVGVPEAGVAESLTAASARTAASKIATEGAEGYISKLLDPLVSGLKKAGSVIASGGPIGSGVKIGATSGLLQGVASGDNTTGQLASDTGTGALFGGALGGILGAWGSGAAHLRGLSGISPKMANDLSSAGISQSELGDYIDTAIARGKSSFIGGDMTNPTISPLGLANQKMQQAGDMILQKINNEAGPAVGKALKANAGKTLVADGTGIPAADSVFSEFTRKVENTFGHAIEIPHDQLGTIHINGELYSGESSGAEANLSRLPGRGTDISSGDQTRIMNVYQQLRNLADNPTLQMASDVEHNIYKMVDYSNQDIYGATHDPLEGLLKSTAPD